MRALVAVALTASLALGACGSDRSTPTYSQPGTSVAVKVGDRFRVDLESNPSTGYSWQLASPAGPPLVLVDSDYLQGGSQPGAAGVQRFEFRGAAAGSVTLTFNYLRPWEQGVAPANTAAFPVTVS